MAPAHDPIESSPCHSSAKRQKTANGYRLMSPIEQISSPATRQTQSTKANCYVTQPTQPLEYVNPSRPGDVLIPASSPEPVLLSEPIVHDLSSPQHEVFSRMAPPGTFLNASFVGAKPGPTKACQALASQTLNSQHNPICLDSDDGEYGHLVIESEEELRILRASDIPAAKKVELNHAKSTPNPSPQRSFLSDNYLGTGDAVKDAKVASVKAILPHLSKSEIISTLTRKGWNETDAIDALMPTDHHQNPTVKGVAKAVAVMAQLPTIKPRRPNAYDAKISIAQKYGHAPSKAGPAQPKRRGLIRGRRNRSPSQSPKQPAAKKPKVELATKLPVDDKDDEEEEEEEEPDAETTASDDSDDQEEPNSPAHSLLLNFFNTCTVEQLVDMASTNQESAALVLEQRPFDGLEDVQNVELAKSARKKGGASIQVGKRILQASEQMWHGLQAIDTLVNQCQTIGSRLKLAMKKLGLDADDSESRVDSGIATPTAAASLSKAAIMSPDLVLKVHQIVGLNWLNVMYKEGISGILADDMGLGKTCQVIAFLSHLVENNYGSHKFHIIVVPGSTLENWMREFQRFSPSINVYPYHGSQAERFAMREEFLTNLDDYHVLLTTYDMATNKADNSQLFRKLRPASVIFDEGHMLKNKNSNRYQMLLKIRTPWRLLLTGTPLQNNLQELISILGFIMPDMFSHLEEDLNYIFKHKAKTTDTNAAALLSVQRVSRAKQMMAPFILRRKKEQIDSQLPPKIKRLKYCTMTDRQKEIYDQQTAIHREALEERANGLAASDLRNYLMERRKASIHPLLFRALYTDTDIEKMHKKLPRDKGKYKGWSAIKMKEEMLWWTDLKIHQACGEHASMRRMMIGQAEFFNSGKVAALMELLAGFDKQDRILVFSQFTTVLDILEVVLAAKNIEFLRLDGSTPVAARQDLIDAFHRDDSYKVFMLSTRSGGAGINLECANKVIIFDSSFNPQDDIQAENRAHRFGQKREVEIIRLVARDTIEEQINTLCQTKLALEDAVTAGTDIERQGMDMVQRMLAEHVKGQSDTQPRSPT